MEPITREEFYLAAAAGEDVPVPEPVTRHDMYMKALIDKGGFGGADWNAAEGEPGHVLNRTHYKETVPVEVVSVAESAVTTTQNAAGYSVLTWKDLVGDVFLELCFVPGDTYIVEYDGVAYTCVAGDAAMGWMGNPVLHAIGFNLGLGDDNGLPFFLYRVAEGNIMLGTSEAGDHTIKVIHLTEETVYHKLDANFLPLEEIELTVTTESGEIKTYRLWGSEVTNGD